MCVESLCDFNATFVFVPTSNIDAAAGWESQLGRILSWNAKYATLVNQVKWHSRFVIVPLAVVIGRGAHAAITKDCDKMFVVVGLSLFLVSMSVHILIPVAFVFFPPNFNPLERKALIEFNADGVPQFAPDDCMPKWSWTVLP